MTSSAPAPPQPEAPADPLRRELTPWIALAILFGALGTLFGAWGALSSLALSREGAIRMAEVSMRAAGNLTMQTDEQRKVQTDFLERMVDVQWSLWPWRALTGSLDLVLSAGLLVGGILLLKRREAGRRLLRGAALGHVPYEAAYVGLGLVTAWRTSKLQADLMTGMLDLQPLGDGADVAKSIASTTALASQVMGMGLVVGTGVGLAVFCLLLARKLNKPDVRAWSA